MHYTRNFLNNVVFQASFNIDSLKQALDKTIMELCSKLTGAEMVERRLMNVTVSMVESQVSTAEKIPSYVFIGDRFRIHIQNDTLKIIDTKYSHHNDFHPIAIEVLTAFNIQYKKPKITRISLRYLNIIKFPEGDTYDFDGLINPTLLAATLDYKDLGLSRSVGTLNIKGEDDLNVKFIYGYTNPEYPNKIVKREFILDYDCYKIVNDSILDIQPFLMEMKDKINTLFDKSILQGLKDIMNT